MKRLILLFFMSLIFMNCSGANLIDPDASIAKGLKSLTIQAIHHPAEVGGTYPDLSEPDGSRLFDTEDGVTIHLTKAALSWDVIELISDGDDEDCVAGFNQTIDIHKIENILDEDLQTLDLASVNIADLAYCRFRILFAGHNDESHGIEDIPEIEGASIYVEGTWDDGIDSGSFEIKITDDVSVTLEFMAKEGDEKIVHPLHFEVGEDSTSVLIGNKYNKWFDHMDFSASDNAIKSQFVTNFLGAIHQHLGEYHSGTDETTQLDDGHDHVH